MKGHRTIIIICKLFKLTQASNEKKVRKSVKTRKSILKQIKQWASIYQTLMIFLMNLLGFIKTA
jgi:hypothetical protein